jgi:Methyltransferase domain
MGRKGPAMIGSPSVRALSFALSFLFMIGFVVNLFGTTQPMSALLEEDSHSSRRATTTTVNAVAHPFDIDRLAYKESFGFFDDISDEDWRRRQNRARLHKHQVDPADKEVKGGIHATDWYLANYYPLFSCPNQQRVGIGGDGPKWVCDPLRLNAINRDTKNKCLVYSVGCNGNYAFEDGLVDLLGAGTCEIHVFDIKPHFGRPNDNVTNNVHFHPFGLKSSYGPEKKGKLLTLQETMNSLGHQGRAIDIFKIDCEGCT